jgi:hypothetical protein
MRKRESTMSFRNTPGLLVPDDRPSERILGGRFSLWSYAAARSTSLS